MKCVFVYVYINIMSVCVWWPVEAGRVVVLLGQADTVKQISIPLSLSLSTD